MRFENVIDVHTHPFTEETLFGQGISYTEAHDFFGRSPESPHHQQWYVERKAKPIQDSQAELVDGKHVTAAVVVNMNACNTWARSLPNDFIAKYVGEFPNFYLGYGGVDPNMNPRGALREVERCAKELGLVGLKFHPAYQDFYPNDHERAYPIYEACEALSLPILVHTGTTRMTHCSIRSCKPEFLDEVATDFPNLRIIMTHFGWPWTAEALAVTWRHEHVYLDLSGWLPSYILATEPLVFQYMNSVLSDKLVFGSDYPAISPKTWLEEFGVICEQGFDWGGKRRHLKTETIQKFLRDNAQRALMLDLKRPSLNATASVVVQD
jgi:predicted TIM-barrel fold metal-dependent hydrolase